ncbi:PepSY-associated TM helix domain-containing protein [Rhodoplanes sp. SY1]|uniref:PepSY-associated TM helix domain-containing protein n=1 Tax=Rhodoplanes sp. SY1 TaxID=3166646 RepID=UPI0038B5D671
MTPRAVKIWSRVHTWTSLISTVFLLMLCITGLPLIFHHEIEHLTGETAEPAVLPAGTPMADLDRIVTAGVARYPGYVPHYVVWDRDEAALVHVVVSPTYTSPVEENRLVTLDGRTAEVLGQPAPGGFMHVMLQLHVDMFAGLPGKLFLGAMGLLFAVAIVSGVVLYAPFMRRLDFGTVRATSSRARWLDVHNLLGVVTVVWALVVGLTGTINTLAELMIGYWQKTELAEMVRPYAGKPPLAQHGSVQAAVDAARAAAPGKTTFFMAFPKAPYYTDQHHFVVFMRGEAPLTSRLMTPVLVDGETATVTATRELPWYLKALLVSQPLHFGDYGGMPLKILWALLDLITIAVLCTGLYLWVVRRRSRIGARRIVAPDAIPSAPSTQPAE